MKKLESLHIAGGNVIRAATVENGMTITQGIKNRITICFSNSTLDIYPKEVKARI